MFIFHRLVVSLLYYCRPEAIGVVTACAFLVMMFLFIPFPFGARFFNGNFVYEEVNTNGSVYQNP